MAELVNLSNISSTNIGNSAKSLPVLFDSGANCCVTHRRDDFVGEYTKLTHGPIVDGIGKGLKIVGQGNVAWTFMDEDNMYRTLKLPCYYVPSSQTWIASIGHFLGRSPRRYFPRWIKMTIRNSMTRPYADLTIRPSISQLLVPYNGPSNSADSISHKL
jgi:hypothetical protein